MNIRSIIEEHPFFVIIGIAISSFGAGWGAYKTVLETSNQIVISQDIYDELIKIRDVRGLSDNDKKYINKIIAEFNSKAFTKNLPASENFRLMFKRFNDVRIELQKNRPLINNRVYSKLLATAEKDLDCLMELSPWSVSELSQAKLEDKVDLNKDNEDLQEWAKGKGKSIFKEMRSDKPLHVDEPLYFSELFHFVRKKQEPLLRLIEAIDRIHKNGILDAA